MINVDQLAVSTIRVLAAEAVQKANSGHPGLPPGSRAHGVYALVEAFETQPQRPRNGRTETGLVLSAGHGSMLIYSLLHIFGYGLTREDLMNFRQWGSKTPGHPEHGHTVGVETTTGPPGAGHCQRGGHGDGGGASGGQIQPPRL